MSVDCSRCDMRGVACQDCVVAVLTPRNAARHLEAEELRALSVLADAGMVPPLRLSVTAPASLPASRTWAFPVARAS
jgi:hypothetical protein